MNSSTFSRLVLTLVLLSTGFAHAAVTSETDTVKGRPATVSNSVIINQSAPGLNPAQGDTLAVTYDYSDPDAIPEDTVRSSYSWMADDAAVGGPVTGNKTWVPGTDVLNKILKVQITAAESAPSDPETATMAETAPAAAPVLPPRANFEAGYHIPGQSLRWGDAYMYCANRNERLATEPELVDFYLTYTRANTRGDNSGNDLQGTYGASITASWSSLLAGEGNHSTVNFTDGAGVVSSDSSQAAFLCARFGGAEGLPSVTNVQIPAGTPAVGTALTATYTYSGNATIPDRSRFQWFRATDAAGAGKTAIEGATAVTYTPVAADAGKWLIIDVTPASYDTVVGTVVSDASDAPLPAGIPDASQSVIIADKASVVAGSGEEGTFTVSMKDAAGNPLTGLDVNTMSLVVTGNGDLTWSGMTDIGDGNYSQRFTVGAMAGQVTASGVTINGTTLNLTPVSMAIIGAPDAANSVVTLNKKAMKGDGVDTNTATVTIKDSAGNVLSGKQVEFQRDSGDWSSTVEQGSGVYTASFTGIAGSLHLGKVTGILVDGVPLDTNDVPVDFYPVNDFRFDFDTGAGGSGWNMENEQSSEGLGFYVGSWLAGAGNGTDTRPQQNGNVIIPERNIIAVKVQHDGYRFTAVVVTYSDNTERFVGKDEGNQWVGYMPSNARDVYIGYVKGMNGNSITRMEFNLKH